MAFFNSKTNWHFCSNLQPIQKPNLNLVTISLSYIYSKIQLINYLIYELINYDELIAMNVKILLHATLELKDFRIAATLFYDSLALFSNFLAYFITTCV